MAEKKVGGQATAALALRSRADLMASPGGLLAGQAKTEEQLEILGKVDTDFLRQRAVIAKELHGQQLITRGAEAAGYQFVRFVKSTQELRVQVQGNENKQKVEQFLSRLEEDHANALLATHYIATDRVQEIVAAPVDPPVWNEEVVEVEVPNLFQQIFGEPYHYEAGTAMSMANSTQNRERLAFTTVPQPGPLADCCEFAAAFLAVCEPMVEAVRRSPTEVSVNVALLQLQAQYWMRFEMASKAHRDHIGSRNHHKCLFQVYRYYFFQLRELLLAVNPPPLRPPVAPVRPQANGIFIGEDLGQP